MTFLLFTIKKKGSPQLVDWIEFILKELFTYLNGMMSKAKAFNIKYIKSTLEFWLHRCQRPTIAYIYVYIVHKYLLCKYVAWCFQYSKENLSPSFD